MRKTYKFLALFLAVTMLSLTCFGSGCSARKKPVVLTMFSIALGKEKSEDNKIRNLITEKTGVQVTEVWMEGQYSRNVIDGWLETPKLPDYMYINERLDEFYDHGLLVAWDPYLEKYPNIKNLHTDEEWDLLRQSDGKIYSVNIPGGPFTEDPNSITNTWGFVVTTSCKDPETAFKFINDILSEEIMDLRFWGIEGVDYLKDNDGTHYRTKEMADMWENEEYGVTHVCEYALMPQ